MSYTKVNIDGHEWNMHKLLVENLNHLKKANRRDWDFKILISGDGLTRVGKTTVAAQIAKYCDPESNNDNWCYDGGLLVKQAIKIGKRRAIIYDEAREGLHSIKTMQEYSQNIINYFNECGYLNQFLIVILPDFFELNKSVALNLSICLINVYTHGNFYRGYFGFYNRKDKRYLYIKGKKYNNYDCQQPTFKGTFNDYFPYDYKELELRKRNSMIKRREGPKGKREIKNLKRLIRVMQHLKEEFNYTDDRISRIITDEEDSISARGVSHILDNRLNEQVDNIL